MEKEKEDKRGKKFEEVVNYVFKNLKILMKGQKLKKERDIKSLKKCKKEEIKFLSKFLEENLEMISSGGKVVYSYKFTKEKIYIILSSIIDIQFIEDSIKKLKKKEERKVK